MSPRKTKRVCIYARVSTSGQTVENQVAELQKVAERNDWEVVAIFKDEGISGTKSEQDRPGFKAVHQAVIRREVDMVMAWSVDRIGRSLVDLLTFLRLLHDKNVDLYLDRQGIDTTTPAGRAMFQMMGVFAEFERAMIVERVNAGLARAKASGIRLGRRPIETDKPELASKIKQLRARNLGIKKIARELGCGVSTVIRVLNQEEQQA